MSQIKNTSILIGKEPNHGRLLIATTVNGQIKTTTIGEIGSVANSVSRCYPKENIAHCKIEIDHNGNMRLHNLKPQNVTYVNNAEILTKKITSDCRISLGKDHYPVNLREVFKAVEKLFSEGPAFAKEYDISSLERVWNDYKAELRAIQERQKKNGLLSRIPILITMTGGAVIGLGGPEIKNLALIPTIIAAIVMVYGLYKSHADSSADDRERVTEDFQQKYVCPNPECKHFVGNIPYSILIQDKTCRYCKCKWTHK